MEKKDDVKKLSDVDVRIMAVMWSADSEFTSRQIYDQCEDMDWKLPALMKQLDRLEEKGFIMSERTSRPNRYKAVISKQEYAQMQLTFLKDKVFVGSDTEFMASILDAMDVKQENLDNFLEKLRTQIAEKL